jgi:hypothetical protein
VQSACSCGLRAKKLLVGFTTICWRVSVALGENVSMSNGS